MTIAEMLREEIEGLPTKDQRTLLTIARSLRGKAEVAPSKHIQATRKVSGKARKAEISAAIRGIAGMWKDRTDLPKDPVQAVKVLRTRMSSRSRHV